MMRLSASSVTAGCPRVRATDKLSVTLHAPTMRSVRSWKKPVRGETVWAQPTATSGLTLLVEEGLAQMGGGERVGNGMRMRWIHVSAGQFLLKLLKVDY